MEQFYALYTWCLLVAWDVQVVPGNPVDDVKLLVGTVASLLRGNALRSAAPKTVNFGIREEEKVAA